MIDLDALKARLAEYDDARPRCQGKVARTINCAPDHFPSVDPTYHEYIITTYSPCCRPEGHEGDCRNSRSVMGWPGFVTVSAMVAEVERLRAEALEREERTARIMLEAERHRRIADEAVERIESAETERAAVVAWLRECALDPEATGAEMRLLQEHATRFERGEHRREEEK